MKQRQIVVVLAILVGFVSLVRTTPLSAEKRIDQKQYDAMISSAVEFLRSRQEPNGAFSSNAGTGVTSLVATALLKHGRSTNEPVIANAISYVIQHVQEDGGIYKKESLYRNYETSLAIVCLSTANATGKYDEIIRNADRFIKKIQWDKGEGIESSDPGFGGAGYGKHKRPDLSNTTFFMEALLASGNSRDSEHMQKALAFVSRCQNLESEHNTTAFPEKNPDGGFYYTAAAGGSSQAGETPNGGLRSYASMTYAGLKSMIYAGVTSDDARIEAATEWIRKHYDLKSNPGMGQAGLFYYYHTFAKALDALGEATFVDAKGVEHNWRAELAAELLARQQENGSWINEHDRWLEGNADLVSGYSLLALYYCRNF